MSAFSFYVVKQFYVVNIPLELTPRDLLSPIRCWRQFLFTTNHLFHVTATQNTNWKKYPDLGEAWTLTICTGSLFSTIVLQESSEKTTSFEGLYRQWYDFALERHEWRKFWFTPNHLFHVTATQNPNWKKISWLGGGLNPDNLHRKPVLYHCATGDLLENCQFLGSLKAMIYLLRKSIDGSNFYLQQTLCFL